MYQVMKESEITPSMRAESDALWQRIDAENALRAENLRLVQRREHERAIANLRVASEAA